MQLQTTTGSLPSSPVPLNSMAIRRAQTDDVSTEAAFGSSRRRRREGFLRRGSRTATIETKIKRPPTNRTSVRQAARNLVSAPGRGDQRSFGERTGALLAPNAGIAGLNEDAVLQRSGGFESVAGVPNLADDKTRAAFNRFFGGRTTFGNKPTSKVSQKQANADPTRANFQNFFFPSQTLADAGVGQRKPNRSFSI